MTIYLSFVFNLIVLAIAMGDTIVLEYYPISPDRATWAGKTTSADDIDFFGIIKSQAVRVTRLSNDLAHKYLHIHSFL